MPHPEKLGMKRLGRRIFPNITDTEEEDRFKLPITYQF